MRCRIIFTTIVLFLRSVGAITEIFSVMWSKVIRSSVNGKWKSVYYYQLKIIGVLLIIALDSMNLVYDIIILINRLETSP